MDYKRLTLISLAVVILDQAVKSIVRRYVEVGNDIQLIGSILQITHTTNTGAGFSMLTGMNSLLIWLGIAIIGGLIYYSTKAPDQEALPIALILGGAIGNLADRIIHGFVIDFIQVPIWPVFNTADSAITIGAAILIIMAFRNKN